MLSPGGIKVEISIVGSSSIHIWCVAECHLSVANCDDVVLEYSDPSG